MQSPWLYIAAALFIFRIVCFTRTRDPLELVQAILWLFLGTNALFPNPLLLGAVAILLLIAILWKLHRWRAVKLARSNRPLPPLTPEERVIRKSLEQSTLQALELHETKLGGRLTPNQLLDWLGVDVEAEEEAFEQRQAETKAQSDKENALIRDEEEESASFAIRREIAVQFKTKKPVEIRTTDSELHPLPAGTYDGKITLNVLPDQNEVSPVTYRFSISSSQREITTEGSLRTFYVPWISGVPTEGEFVYWSEAPTAWKEAFERRCIATRILCFDDGRERFPLVIRTTKQCIMTKYSCWYTDLAVSEDGRKIIVRVRDLWCEVWESDIFETEDPNDVELEDVARLNVFCCEMPIETILPVTAPCDEGYDEEEEKEDLNQRVQNIAR